MTKLQLMRTLTLISIQYLKSIGVLCQVDNEQIYQSMIIQFDCSFPNIVSEFGENLAEKGKDSQDKV